MSRIAYSQKYSILLNISSVVELSSKMVGPKKHDFSKNQNAQRKKNPSMNDGLSKSVKMLLSKSIFNGENGLNC